MQKFLRPFELIVFTILTPLGLGSLTLLLFRMGVMDVMLATILSVAVILCIIAGVMTVRDYRKQEPVSTGSFLFVLFFACMMIFFILEYVGVTSVFF